MVGSAVLFGALAILSGRAVWLMAIVSGPVIGFGLSGAPRSIELDGDTILVHSWLRRVRVFEVATVRVQALPHELVLIGPQATIDLPRRHFVRGEFQACAEALRRRCPSFVERKQLRPKRGGDDD